jgi:hypothetical protein
LATAPSGSVGRSAAAALGAAVGLIGIECADGSVRPIIPRSDRHASACGIKHSATAAVAAEVPPSGITTLGEAAHAAMAGEIAGPSGAAGAAPGRSSGAAAPSIGLVGRDHDRGRTGERPAAGIVDAAAGPVGGPTADAPGSTLTYAGDAAITKSKAVASGRADPIPADSAVSAPAAVGDVLIERIRGSLE